MVRQKPSKSRIGFTIVEFILVLGALVLMAAIAVPRMGLATMYSVPVKITADQFANYLHLTRSLAVSHANTNDRGYKLNLIPPAGPYTSYSIKDLNTDETIYGPFDIPSETICTGVNNGLKFEPSGTLSLGETTSVQFTNGSDTVVITVSPTGRITLQ